MTEEKDKVDKLLSLKEELQKFKADIEKERAERKWNTFITQMVKALVSALVVQLACNFWIGPAFGWPTINFAQAVGVYSVIFVIKYF